MTPYITTFTGKHINPLNPRPEDIDILDIAHALALIPRFAGHTRAPISVAQHSWFVSSLCPNHPLQGLLHDAAEAYLGDVTKWLKRSPEFDAYRRAESWVQSLIYDHFGCNGYQEGWVEVDTADRLMVRYEAEAMLPGHVFPPDYPPVSLHERRQVGHWTPWYWEDAERLFIERFDALQKAQRRRTESGLESTTGRPPGVRSTGSGAVR